MMIESWQSEIIKIILIHITDGNVTLTEMLWHSFKPDVTLLVSY